VLGGAAGLLCPVPSVVGAGGASGVDGPVLVSAIAGMTAKMVANAHPMRSAFIDGVPFDSKYE
jgi:hypothetical protein